MKIKVSIRTYNLECNAKYKRTSAPRTTIPNAGTSKTYAMHSSREDSRALLYHLFFKIQVTALQPHHAQHIFTHTTPTIIQQRTFASEIAGLSSAVVYQQSFRSPPSPGCADTSGFQVFCSASSHLLYTHPNANNNGCKCNTAVRQSPL